jgi:hypothetical protein
MRRRQFIGYLSVIGAAAGSTLFGQGSSAQSCQNVRSSRGQALRLRVAKCENENLNRIAGDSMYFPM